MDDEAEVGLVVAHPERAGRDDRLELVAEQPVLHVDAALRLDLAAVGLGGDPARGEPLGDHVRVALGERVDDPGAGQLRQPPRQPGQPVGLPRQLHDLEPEARPAQLAPVGLDGRRLPAVGELLGHVRHHAVVGGGRRAEHRHAVGQPGEHVAQPPVVRPEVVPPVADAVRLVDHHEAHPGREQRQHLVPELRVVQALGADQQQVHRVVGEQPAHGVPLVAVRRVDRVRPDPQTLRGRDLVAHQRQQRRDDQRRPGAGLAQQRGREEVDRRLPPAGPLHAQHPRPVGHEVAHRLELVLAERGVRPRELAEQLQRAGFHRGGRGHPNHDRRPGGELAPRVGWPARGVAPANVNCGWVGWRGGRPRRRSCRVRGAIDP